MAELAGYEILAKCLKAQASRICSTSWAGRCWMPKAPASRKASARSTPATSRVRPIWRRPIRG